VYESAQGFCLAGILVGARVPALLAAADLLAAAVMAIIFTPSVNFSEVLVLPSPFLTGLL
jgi:hypothetical protein